MPTFEIGNSVIIKEGFNNLLSGSTGVIKDITDAHYVAVEFNYIVNRLPSKIKLHDCGGRCEDERGFYILKKHLDLFKEVKPEVRRIRMRKQNEIHEQIKEAKESAPTY